VDIFIGGGGDDLSWLGLGVVRQYALRFAAETRRPVVYLPNARLWRAGRLIRAASDRGETVNLIGHSWGAIDAYVVAVRAAGRGVPIASLVTLDPVSGPLRRPPAWPGGPYWLNVTLAPTEPDRSDRLTARRPWARKPSRLPLEAADASVVLDLNHWDVGRMMRLSGARELLDGKRPVSEVPESQAPAAFPRAGARSASKGWEA
jgi:pimeloyl-ACP methyl ester carboxylesterase